jgi:PAS domain S-box-containing protein
MIIGASRVAVGPLRDLDQLDETVALIGRVPGVDAVAVEAFVGRRVLLTVHALHPLDLSGSLRSELGDGLLSCGIVGERLEVVLADAHPGPDPFDRGGVVDHHGSGNPDVEAIDVTWEEVPDAGVGAPAVGTPRGAQRVATSMTVTREVTSGRRELLVPAEPEQLLELSFAQAPVAKALISTDGRWLRVNRRLCRLLGRDEAALLRCDLQDVTHAHDLEIVRGLAGEALDGVRDGWSLDTRWIAGDGEELSVRVDVSLVRAADGDPLWFVFEVVEPVRPARSRTLAVTG